MYSQYFQKFLDHTDEKKIFAQEIGREIQGSGARSMLDIGAGNGILSAPLAKLVSHYVAIESDRTHVAKLQAAGLMVIAKTFPCAVNGPFDFVLASHALPYSDHENQEQFLHAAWDAVAESGTLLVTTYRSEEEDDWTYLMRELGENRQEAHSAGFQNIRNILSSFTEVHVRKVETHVRADTVADMVEALAFVFSDNDPEARDAFRSKKGQLEDIFETHYRFKNQYSFPFQHFFLKVTRPQDRALL